MTTARLIRSEVRRLHTLPGLREIPEYVTALEALARIQEAQRRPPSNDDTLDDIAGDIADACRAGAAPDLDETAARIAAIEQKQAAQTQAAHLLTRAETHLLNDVDEIARGAIPALLEQLNTTLRDTLRRLAAIPNRDQLTDGDTAIRLGRVDDWTRFQRLREIYFETRGAQGTIYSTAVISTRYTAAALIRRQEELMPAGGWVAAQRGGTWRNEHGELCSPDPTPWPDLDAPTLQLHLTAPAWLEWTLAHPGALDRAWVPTAAELAAETQRLNALTAATDPPTQLTPHTRVVSL